MCTEYFSNTNFSPLEDKRKVQHKKLQCKCLPCELNGVRNEDPSPSSFQEYLWCTSLKVEETNHQVRDEEGNRMTPNYLGLTLLTCLCISGPKSDICLGFSIADALCKCLLVSQMECIWTEDENAWELVCLFLKEGNHTIKLEWTQTCTMTLWLS